MSEQKGVCGICGVALFEEDDRHRRFAGEGYICSDCHTLYSECMDCPDLFTCPFSHDRDVCMDDLMDGDGDGIEDEEEKEEVEPVQKGVYVGNLGWLHLIVEILRYRDAIWDYDGQGEEDDREWRLALRDSLYTLCADDSLKQISVMR